MLSRRTLARGAIAAALLVGTVACGGKETPQPEEVAKEAASLEERERPRPEAELLVVDPATAATIRGVVRFEGVPPRISTPPKGDTHCERVWAGRRIPDERIVVNEDGTLRNVVLQIVGGLEGKRFEEPKGEVLLDQNRCMYVPHVLVVRAGQTLVVRNSDSTNHNINGTSAKKNDKFNFGQQSAGIEDRLTFKRPETIRVKCDRHGWMGAWIHVVAHPYVAVTGDEGTFVIGNLPPGAYTLEAWHEFLGRQTRDVTLAASAVETVEFTFRESASDEGKR